MIRDPHSLANTGFDVLVIGGGIHGACVAREAARAGLCTALVERGDFGSGTSHNSLKIVHGGLRYLQHLDLARTRESVRERSFWLRSAPHLVRPLGFLMPLHDHLTRGPLALWAGLRTHELIGRDRNRGLADDRRLPRGQLISADEVKKIMPGLKNEHLTGGAIWYDGQMLDADRLLMICIEDAVARGAVVSNYVSAQRIAVKDGKVQGAELEDALSGERFFARAARVINAAGPWAGELAQSALKQPATTQLRHTKNMNLIVPQVIASELAVGVKSRRRSDSLLDASNRLFFITPWRGMSVIGTTHVPYVGTADACRFEADDVEGFLAEINAAYAFGLTPDDVCYCYGGLTPADDGHRHGEPRRAKRGAIIDHGASDRVAGLFSLIGIKYTTARLSAEQAVDSVVRSLGCSDARRQTRDLELPGGAAYESQAALEARLADAIGTSGGAEQEAFAATFGADIDAALKLGAWSPADGEDALFRCRVRYAVRREMAQRLEDVVIRRSDRLARGRLSEQDLLWAGDFMARELDWTPARQRDELEAARRAAERHWAKLRPMAESAPSAASHTG